MARSPKSPQITPATKLDPAEAERRIAVEAVRYMEIRKPPKPRGNGLGALVRATFKHIAAMRENGLSWDEVREVFLRAEALHVGIKSVQLAGEFRYQLRYREGRLQRRGKTVEAGHSAGQEAKTSTLIHEIERDPVTKHSQPSAPFPPQPELPLPMIVAKSDQQPAPIVEKSGQRMPGAIGDRGDRVSSKILLRDGREFPIGTTRVPLMPIEQWSAKEAFKFFGTTKNAPLEPPMVDIETLINSGEDR